MRTIVHIGIISPEGLKLRLLRGFPERESRTLQARRPFPLSGLLLVSFLTLAACGEMPAARTNCWTVAASGGPEVSQAAISPSTLAAPATSDPSKCD